MANSNHSKENLEHSRLNNSHTSKSEQEALPTLNTAEVVGANLDQAEAMGNISEQVNESTFEDKAGQGQNSSGRDDSRTQAIDVEVLKKKLLSEIPTESVVRQQISKHINREIDALHKRAVSLLKQPSHKVNYFELTIIARKIRELKGILAALVKMSVENLKGLWLRFVHGIM